MRRKIVVLYTIGGFLPGILFSICVIVFRWFCNVPFSRTEFLLVVKTVVALVAMGTFAGLMAGLVIAVVVGVLQR
jgi:hypothetical protein